MDLWQDVMFSPNKMVVAGFGVDNHENFCGLVDTYLGSRKNVDSQGARGNNFLSRSSN